ncbi:MAG: hypothetical protein ABSE74_05360 [Methanoregula sp.]
MSEEKARVRDILRKRKDAMVPEDYSISITPPSSGPCTAALLRVNAARARAARRSTVF